MNFLRAYQHVFLFLSLMAFIAAVADMALNIAIVYHIVGQHDPVGAAAIGALSGIVTTLLLLPLIWWYLDKYL